MNRLTITAFLFLLISCGKNAKQESSTEGNLLENLSITIDTVRVDVGEEIFNPGMYYQFGLSEDGQSVYFALNQEPEVHEINLQNLQLVRRIYFEKDGPNRAPNFINYFDVLPKNEFMLAHYGIQGIYNEQAEKIQAMEIQPDEFKGLDEDLNALYFNLTISPDKKLAFSTPNKPSELFSAFIAKMNLEQKTGELIPLPALEITKNFQVTFRSENSSTTYGDFISIQKVKDQLVIYSGSTSDLYLYDFTTDSLILKTFNHQLIPSKKTGSFPSKVDSQERVREVGDEINQQATFSGLYWDPSRKLYFRFGSKSNGKLETGEPKKKDVYLFAYDEKLQLLGEQKVDLPYPFGRAFFFEGKLYSYRPVDEDPGFVRMTLTY
ncbi:DUF4221 family protein [Algoriphagus algorifonticola]|uniref:DUF4221 family protein n=1 Tax=Algoriphagus algorifonticola TaxID=2593007 RepID=UPI00119DF795|nr:DUF4221 family protein [Algoriphagus algorifonticola]